MKRNRNNSQSWNRLNQTCLGFHNGSRNMAYRTKRRSRTKWDSTAWPCHIQTYNIICSDTSIRSFDGKTCEIHYDGPVVCGVLMCWYKNRRYWTCLLEKRHGESFVLYDNVRTIIRFTEPWIYLCESYDVYLCMPCVLLYCIVCHKPLWKTIRSFATIFRSYFINS